MLQQRCLFAASPAQHHYLVDDSPLRCCNDVSTALPLRRCDSAAMLPLRYFTIAMLQWHRLFTAMIHLPFDAAGTSPISRHFFSSFLFLLLPSSFLHLPPLFLHRTFLFNLFFFLIKTSVSTGIPCVCHSDPYRHTEIISV
ncbi:hypothetical protein GW17_00058477 [Ensete ventricosum]|nr:hypothetical protein GW17_00058477 [Ensete ventricosum]